MSALSWVLLLALGLGVWAVLGWRAGRVRCPRCSARVPGSARQCPHCGQVLGLTPAGEDFGPPRYCPECRSEFRSEVQVCPECETALQNHLPVPVDDAEARGPLQTLCAVSTPEEADFLITVLAEQNIRAAWADAEPRTAFDFLSAPLVTVGAGRILVAENDLPAAKAVLAAIEADAEVLSPAEEAGEWVCDACGAEVGPTAAVCPRCGVEFEADQEKE